MLIGSLLHEAHEVGHEEGGLCLHLRAALILDMSEDLVLELVADVLPLRARRYAEESVDPLAWKGCKSMLLGAVSKQIQKSTFNNFFNL